MKWTCSYYVTDSGRVPVKEFIDSLTSRTQQKFFAVVGMLEHLGKSLPEPHAKSLGNGVYELRFRGQEGHVRILHFFYDDNRCVLTNGFIKKSNKTPKKEIELAEDRRTQYLNRKK
ncbi:MAG: type II toxin-antitoxin system RelE/ParE family toxin [Candidatus Omnitrophota bacterium]